MVRSIYTNALLGMLFLMILSSCSHPPVTNVEGPYWKDNDALPIREPEYDEPSLAMMHFQRAGPDQLLELLDMDRNVRKLTGNPTQAKNTNSYDEVPNSSWFTNRHGYPATHLTEVQLTVGLSITEGPDTSGIWLLFRPKLGGTTPGFWIEDAYGDQYLIKFDPTDNREMATAAAAIGSRYFHACGYNVPQETIVYWRPDKLRIREGAKIKLQDGSKRLLTMHDIDTVLAKVRREPDGSIRSLASYNLGNVKGPFMYDGVDHADSNDWCPHQHRRELRGLRVIGSLVNHYDLKDHNTMNVYVGEPDSGYLKHYLMDFGSTFGSDGSRPKIPRKGYANYFDLRDAIVNLTTLGLKTWKWEDAKPAIYTSVGYFESDLFEPSKFDPIMPNPAFEQLTNQDAYWGAKIVMAFNDDDIDALVSAGQLSNPDAVAYLTKILRERQGKIGRHWFSKVNPIDFPRLTITTDKMMLSFDDLWILGGLGEKATHNFSVRYRGRDIIAKRPTDGESLALSSSDLLLLRQAMSDCNDKNDCSMFDIQIYSERDGKRWKMPTIFTLYLSATIENARIVRIQHPD